MLRGLKSLAPKFQALNIAYFLVKGDPIHNIPQLVASTKAALLVTDFAPTELGRKWRDTVLRTCSLPCSPHYHLLSGCKYQMSNMHGC